MANEDVKISVAIDAAQAKSGAAEAKQAVDAVAKSTASTGDAGAAAKQAGNNVNDLGKSAHKAGDELFDFHKKGEKLVKEMLAILNPSLAQGADFALDLAEGTSKITPQLLAVAGTGAVVGVLVGVFRAISTQAEEAAKRIERVSKAMEEMRDRAGEINAEVTKALQAAGVSGFAATNDAARQFNADPLSATHPEEVAQAVGLTQRLGLKPSQYNQLLAGMLRGARPSLTGDNMKDADAIVQTLEAGTGDDAAAFLREARENAMNEWRRKHLPSQAFDQVKQAIDAELKALQTDSGGRLTDGDVVRMRKIMENGVTNLSLVSPWQRIWAMQSTIHGDSPAEAVAGELRPPGSEFTVNQLRDMAGKIQVESRGRVAAQLETPDAQAPIIRIIVEDARKGSTNIGTLNQRIGDPPAFNPSLAVHEGID